MAPPTASGGLRAEAVTGLELCEQALFACGRRPGACLQAGQAHSAPHRVTNERGAWLRARAQLRLLQLPVPDGDRRVLLGRVRGPADQQHQLRPVRLLLRQPAQRAGARPRRPVSPLSNKRRSWRARRWARAAPGALCSVPARGPLPCERCCQPRLSSMRIPCADGAAHGRQPARPPAPAWLTHPWHCLAACMPRTLASLRCATTAGQSARPIGACTAQRVIRPLPGSVQGPTLILTCSLLLPRVQNAHCGACLTRRGARGRAQTAQCVAGNCIATCLSAALTKCQTGSGPFCANLQTDPNYCGSCANSCPADPNSRGTRVCTAGVRARRAPAPAPAPRSPDMPGAPCVHARPARRSVARAQRAVTVPKRVRRPPCCCQGSALPCARSCRHSGCPCARCAVYILRLAAALGS